MFVGLIVSVIIVAGVRDEGDKKHWRKEKNVPSNLPVPVIENRNADSDTDRYIPDLNFLIAM